MHVLESATMCNNFKNFAAYIPRGKTMKLFSEWARLTESTDEKITKKVMAVMKELGIEPGKNTPSSYWGWGFYNPDRKLPGISVGLFKKQAEMLKDELDRRGFDTEMHPKGHLNIYASQEDLPIPTNTPLEPEPEEEEEDGESGGYEDEDQPIKKKWKWWKKGPGPNDYDD